MSYDKRKLEIELRNRQRALNKEYANSGFSDELLMKQVELNKLRHELGIVDETEIIYEDFVQ